MNSFEPINPSLIDVVLPSDEQGYPAELAAGDTRDVLKDVCGDASRDFPSSLWIEPRDWPDKARENDRLKTWPLNYLDRFTNQNPTHECTCHALRAVFESARNRARGINFEDGPIAGRRLERSATASSVWVSPLSVYAEANPRQWGGASVRGVFSIALRRGLLPEGKQPKNYGFKHTLVGTTGRGGVNQESGSWVSLSRFPEGWEETANLFKPKEFIFPETAEQIVCLVLHGYSVGVGRNGHAIPYTHWNAAEQAMGYTDSYDVIRWDSFRTVRSAVGGAYAIASVTTPDDWERPAA